MQCFQEPYFYNKVLTRHSHNSSYFWSLEIFENNFMKFWGIFKNESAGIKPRVYKPGFINEEKLNIYGF